jgi:hypothetical protein
MHRETVQRNLRHRFVHSSLWHSAPTSAVRKVGPPGMGHALPGFDIYPEGLTLELAFESKSLRTICESEFQARLELDATVAEMLKHRLADLRAATCANDIVAGRPRAIDGPDGECMVVDLAKGNRLVFTANHVNNPVTEDSGFDWARVSRIKVLRIESDHR